MELLIFSKISLVKNRLNREYKLSISVSGEIYSCGACGFSFNCSGLKTRFFSNKDISAMIFSRSCFRFFEVLLGGLGGSAGSSRTVSRVLSRVLHRLPHRTCVGSSTRRELTYALFPLEIHLSNASTNKSSM